MTITAQTAVRTILAASAPVAALVGNRISPPPIPQASAFPAITLQRISTVQQFSLDGVPGLCRIRLQIDSWAPTQAGAEAVAAAVKDALQGYGGTVEGLQIAGAFFEDESDGPFEADVNLHRISADYFVVFKEDL